MKIIKNILITGSLNIGLIETMYENIDELLFFFPEIEPQQIRILDRAISLPQVVGFVKGSKYTKDKPDFVYVSIGLDKYEILG